MIRDDGENRGNVRAMAVFAALGLGAAGLGAGSALAWLGWVGTVFERSAGGTYRLRHAFNGADGSRPAGGAVADSASNLCGTTASAGAKDAGTIFRLTPSGILTTLYSFCSMTGCTDGSTPNGGLIGDANGNLYGTTGFGGAATCDLGYGCASGSMRMGPTIPFSTPLRAAQATGNPPMPAFPPTPPATSAGRLT
jgi:uncharacterized repeat protein (TIGR03803 family)